MSKIPDSLATGPAKVFATRKPPVAVAIAPNGGRRTKADHPALPTTTAELVRVAAESLEAGAAMIHLHIRDPQGRHLLDAETYRRTIAAIKQTVGDRLVIQITSESIGRYEPAAQMAMVKALRPEAVSLGLRELVPDATSERYFADFLAWLKRERVTPQIILYSTDEARRLGRLNASGLIPWPNVPVLFVLGSYAGTRTSEPADLLPYLAPDMPHFAHWMICAFGRNEAACVTAAAQRGGHVRVGFENNLFQPDGTLAPDNAAQVRTTCRMLRAAGCRLADATSLRAAWATLQT